MGIFNKISDLFTGRRELDSVAAESLSDALVMADIAPDLAESLVAGLRARGAVSGMEAKQILFDAMLPIVNKLTHHSSLITRHSKSPAVILVIGVNGAGKTTSIGKLAKQWVDAGQSVVIGACDTFRAAAEQQLAEWAGMAGAQLITAHQQQSANKCGDPASVAYSAVDYGIKNNFDIVILDTAGRLHNRDDLMEELAKITRIIKKLDLDAPDDILLVLDGTSGQNALNQIEYFNRVVPLTGLIVTKMDSTSKGGILVTYAANTAQPLPIVAIGAGEKMGDMGSFSAENYLSKLLDIEI